MTITTTKNRINQLADGIQTIFIYDFIVLDASHMFPYFDDVLQVAGFTVNGVGDPAGGDVTFDVAPADGATVTLQRVVPFTQLVDYIPYDPFPAETHEGALDKLTLITQQIEDSIARSLQLPVSTAAGDLTLPEPIPQHFLQWNNAGDGLINVTLVDIGAIIVTPFAETLLDDPDADTFWATLMATITKLTARSTLGAAGLIDANTFTNDNTFDGANILNGINTFNDKAIFNGVIHQKIGSNIPSAAALPNITDGNYAHVTELAAGITGATQANPVVITAIAHGLANGDKATLADVGGMIEINGIEYTVANVTANTFELSGIDGTGFTAYAGGGSIWASITSLITTAELGTIIHREFDGELVLTHHATALILFNDVDIITAAGDVAELLEYATGDFKLIDYTRADGTSLNAGATTGASMVLLGTASADDDTTIEFTGIDNTYERYEIQYAKVTVSINAQHFRLRTSSDGGATYDSGASDYAYGSTGFLSNNTVQNTSSNPQTYISITNIGVGSSAGYSLSGEVIIYAPSDASTQTLFGGNGVVRVSADHVSGFRFGGARKEVAIVDAVQLYLAAGNILTGEFRLYGIKDA